jgi:hypothetical protein
MSAIEVKPDSELYLCRRRSALCIDNVDRGEMTEVVRSMLKSKTLTASLMDMIPGNGNIAGFLNKSVNEMLRFESSRIGF